MRNSSLPLIMRMLLGLALLALAAGLCPPAFAQPDTGEKFVGNILKHTGIPEDYLEYWNQATSENQGKWGRVEAERDVMTWDLLDQHYAYTREHNIPYKFHVFVWDKEQPEWMDDLPPEQQREEVEEWIEAVLERYPDMEMIDVVNEPVNHPAKYRRALGGGGETGWDWVIWTFQKVRDLDPDAKLLLNEYDTLKNSGKRAKYIEIIKALKERGLIDGIGLQGHFLEGVENEKLQAALEEYAALEVPIYISELDVNIGNDERQKKRLAELFPLFWEHPSVAGVTFWGYEEGGLWRKKAWLVNEDGSPRPAMQWLQEYLKDHPAETAPQ